MRGAQIKEKKMVFKRITICIFSFFCLVAFAEEKVITIATLEYPPFIYSDGDLVKGPIAEKVINTFKKIGVTAKIEILPIARGLLMVKTGQVDAYFTLKKTPERENDLLFTKTPLLQQPFVFFINKNSKIQWNGNLEDIKNYKIGVVSKTSYGPIFDGLVQKGYFTNLDETQNFELNIKKLIAGRIDLVINSYDVGEYLIQKLKADSQIIALNPPIEKINSYLAFTKARDYSILAQQFDKIIEKEEK